MDGYIQIIRGKPCKVRLFSDFEGEYTALASWPVASIANRGALLDTLNQALAYAADSEITVLAISEHAAEKR